MEKDNKFYYKLNELVSQQNVKSSMDFNKLNFDNDKNPQRALNLHLEQLQKYSEAARNIDMNKLDDQLTKRNKNDLHSTGTYNLQANYKKQNELSSMADKITLKSSLAKKSISTSPYQIHRNNKNQQVFSLQTMKTQYENTFKDSTKNQVFQLKNPFFKQNLNTLNDYYQNQNGPEEIKVPQQDDNIQENVLKNMKIQNQEETEKSKNIQNETFNISKIQSIIEINNEEQQFNKNYDVQKPFQFISEQFKNLINKKDNVANRRNSQNTNTYFGNNSSQKYEYQIKNLQKSPISIKKEIQRIHIGSQRINSNQKRIRLLDFNNDQFKQNQLIDAIDSPYQNKKNNQNDNQNSINNKNKGFQLTDEQKQKYLIVESPQQLIKSLDLKIKSNNEKIKSILPEQSEQLKFVEKRLKKVLNYGKLQNDLQDDNHVNNEDKNRLINCSVKQKIFKYLKGKDERCQPPFSQDNYKNEILRKQLMFTDMGKNKKANIKLSSQQSRRHHQKKDNQTHHQCQHFETLESIIYESEKQIFENPLDFKLFLTSPWVCLVKNKSEKELASETNNEKDLLSSIKNKKIKEIIQQILELYVQAGTYEQQNNINLGLNKPSNICLTQIDSSKQILTTQPKLEESIQKVIENLEAACSEKEKEQEQIIKEATKNLNLIFKDQNIRLLQQFKSKTQQTEFSARSFDDQLYNADQHEQDFTNQQIEIPFFPQKEEKYEACFNNLQNQQQLYEIGKYNYNFLHPKQLNNNQQESQMLFNYSKKQNETEFSNKEYQILSELQFKSVQNDYQKYGGEYKDKKMGMSEYLELYPPKHKCQFDSIRKIPLFPTVQNYWNAYRKRFEIIGLQNVEDLNCQAIGEYMQNLPIAELHIQYSKLTDLQLSQLLNGVSKNGKYQYLWSLSLIGDNIGNLELGMNAIESVISILQAKQDNKNIKINDQSTQAKDFPNQAMHINLQKVKMFDEQSIKIQKLAVLSIKGLKINLKDFEFFLNYITLENQLSSLKHLQISQQHLQISSSSSKNKAFQLILQLISQQRYLRNLDLSQNQLSFKQMEALINICTDKLQKGLQKLNLSGNSLRKTQIQMDSKQKMKLKKKINETTSVQLVEQILYYGLQLTDLDISSCDIDWKQMLELSKSFQNSPCLRSFKISCLDGFCDQDEQALHQYRTLFFQTFGVQWNYNLMKRSINKKFDLQADSINSFRNQEEQALRDLYIKNQQKNNKQINDKKFQFNDGIFEFYRKSNFCEHIFKNAQTLKDEIFDFDKNLKWEMKTLYEQYDLIPTLVIFDRNTINIKEQTEWKEIPIDFNILNKIQFDQNDQQMLLPILITQDHIQPLIPARFFTLFNFLGNYVDQFTNNFVQDPNYTNTEQIFNCINLIKKGFASSIYHKVKKRKIFEAEKNKNQRKQEGAVEETEKSICSEIRTMLKVLTQKCDGWFQYMQQNILDKGASEYNQVIGLTNQVYNQLVQKQNKIEMEEADIFYKKLKFEIRDEDFFASSVFFKPLLKEQKVILFDPTLIQHESSHSDNPIGKMYVWQGIIKRKGAMHQKMEIFKQQNVQIQPVPNIVQFQQQTQ